jgi:hypothetical protein
LDLGSFLFLLKTYITCLLILCTDVGIDLGGEVVGEALFFGLLDDVHGKSAF